MKQPPLSQPVSSTGHNARIENGGTGSGVWGQARRGFLVLAVLFLGFATSANAGIALLPTQASQYTTNSTTTGKLAGFTVAAGSNRLLVVTTGDPNSPTNPSAVTFNGTPMLLGNSTTDNGFSCDSIWYLTLPGSSAVTGDILVTFASSGSNTFISAAAFSGVDQTTPVDTSGPKITGSHQVSSDSFTVPSQAGSLVFDQVDTYLTGSLPAATPGASQTVISNGGGAITTDAGANDHYYTSTQPGAAPNVTMSWTSNAGAILHLAMNIHAAAASPTVTASTASVALGTTTAGTASTPAQSFTVGGSNLTANLIVSAPTGVELSKNSGTSWQTSETLTPSGGTVGTTTIQARISAGASAGSISGNITCASSGATTQNVSVTGTVNAAPTVGSQGFSDIGAASGSTASDTPADINTAAKITIGNLITTGSQSGYFSGLSTQIFGPVTFTVSSPTSLTFGNGTMGSFTSTSIIETQNTSGTRSFYIRGQFTAGTFNATLTPTPAPASLLISFTQSPAGNGAISDSATLSIPPTPTPTAAPASTPPTPTLPTQGVTNGSQGLSDIGAASGSTASDTPADINTAAKITIGNLITTGSQSGYFSGLSTQIFGPITFTVSSPTSLTFGNATMGSFASTSIVETQNTSGTRSFYIRGQFTAGTFNPTLTPTPAPASLLISFTQSPAGSGAISNSATLSIPPSAPFIELVDVGNPGNTADTATTYGAVSYAYKIGKYEITLAQYAAFLNAVAKTDIYGLYITSMATDLNVAGITRSGSSGSYTYTVFGSGNRPVTYVSWFEASRFTNWLANGQPTGAQGNTTTENGTYTLNGATSGVNFTKNATNPNTSAAPTYWIPSEDEWYKAAYYDPTKGGSNYWLYPTKSDTAPGNNGLGTNRANYNNGVYSVTQSAINSGSQNYLTDAGAFGINSASYYGTNDQGGNAMELNDTVIGSKRGLRGGYWVSNSSGLQSLARLDNDTNAKSQSVGFRVAAAAATTPTVTASTASVALGTTTAGTASTPAQSFTVSGSNLTANLIVTAPTGVELSKDSGISWQTSETLTPSSGTVSTTTIQARIAASASVGSISGVSITCTSTGATTQNVSVTGTVNAGPNLVVTTAIVPTPLAVGSIPANTFPAGDTGTVNVVLTNSTVGSSPAGVTSLAVTLPAQFTIRTLSTPQSGFTLSQSGQVVTISGGTVANGAPVTVAIPVSTASNLAYATALTIAAPVLVAGSGVTQSPAPTGASATSNIRSDFSLSFGSTPSSIVIGNKRTVTVTLTNNGPSDAPSAVSWAMPINSNVTISNLAQAVVPGAGGTVATTSLSATTSVTASFGAFASGGTAVVTFDENVASNKTPTSFNDVATVDLSLSANTVDPNTNNGSASLGTTLVSPPTVTASTSSLALGTTTAGTASTPAQSFTVSGSNLTADLIVTAPTGVELSKDSGTSWQTSETLTPSSGTVSTTTIQSRISAGASAGSISGNITCASTGATTQNVSVSGTVNPASFVVTNNHDSGTGSLRAAITSANGTTGAIITFDPTFFATPQTITLTSGQLEISASQTVQGPGAGLLTVSGNNASRVFQIDAGKTASLSGLTITGGNGVGALSSGKGGGILNAGTLTLTNCSVSGNKTPTSEGGGISNTGTSLTITNCQIDGNTASFSGGGIISRAGTVTITGSTVSNNTVTGATGGAGGGIEADCNLNITNSTFSGNHTDNSGSRSGGGIYCGAQTTTITACTITGNSAKSSGSAGGLRNDGASSVTVKDTIIAGNTGTSSATADVSGAFISSGYNLIGDGTSATGWTGTGDIVGTTASPVNALLGPLGYYPASASVQTVPLLPGSPAINAGTATGTPTADQRGVARVGATDIGAFEAQAFTLALSSGNNQSTVVGTAFTNPLVVTVTSTGGDPVDNGSIVTFTGPSSGAGISPSPVASTIGAVTAGKAQLIATANSTVGGPYTVAATAAGASPTINFSLTNIAGVAPAVTTNPTSQTITAGSNVTFTAAASGNPTPTVQWQEKVGAGSFANITNGGIYSGATSTTLTLTGVTAGMNANQYRAVFTNVVSSDTTTAATLTVNTPNLSINDVTLNEGNAGTTTFTFTVSLSSASSQTVTVNYATADGTATVADNDYFATSGTLTFAPGQTQNTVNVLVNGDSTFEADETFRLTLSNPTNATISTATGTGTITNDDLPGVSVAATTATAVEGGATGLYTFTRESGSGAMTVNFQLDASSTATAGTDFTLTSSGTLAFNTSNGAGTIVIPDTQTAATITLTALVESPNPAEATETARLNVVPSAAVYVVGASPNATVTISANSFLVTTTADSGTGSLRQAVLNANALGGNPTITFDAGVTGTIALTSGELLVSQGMTIQGPGANVLSVSGSDASRIFTINASSNVVISGLTLTNGHSVGSGNDGAGGAIFAGSGGLALDSCQISNNVSDTFGGAIAVFHSNPVNISNSTISGNTANSPGTGGGGISNGGTLNLVNSTVSGNSAPNAVPAGGGGGGIINFGTFTAVNSTITGNRVSAAVGGGGIDARGTESLRNTIVAGNFKGTGSTASDIENGTIDTASNNLIGDATTSGGMTNGTNGNIVGVAVNTVLNATLANNGGPTQTHALLNGSPAINTGSNALALDASNAALTTDQRGTGFSRVVGTVDIGAFELPLSITPNTADLQVTSTQLIINGVGFSSTAADNTVVLSSGTATVTGATGTRLTCTLAGPPSLGVLNATVTVSGVGSTGPTQVATMIAGPATHFSVTAPGISTAGVAFNVAVTALDQYGNTATSYTGTAHFTKSDSGAGSAVPTDYTFTGGDSGVHTFSNSTTLVTAGAQTITATDTVTPAITGTSASIAVGPAAAAKLTVTAPAAVTSGIAFSITVTALDQFNNTATGYTGTAHFTKSDSGAGSAVPTDYTFTGGDSGVHAFSNSTTLVTTGTQTVTARDTVASAITGTSGNITVGTLYPTATQVAGPVGGYKVNPQTGLFDVTVNVTNTTINALNGFRLHVDYSAYKTAFPSLKLQAATSYASYPDVYIDYPYPVAVGATVPMHLTFFTSNRQFPNPFAPILSVTTLSTSQTAQATNAGVQVSRILVQNPGPTQTILIEFPTIPGRWYRVSFSTNDMSHWLDSQTPIQATATKTQWIDNGAPFTDSPPAPPSVTSRFYKVGEITTP